MTIKTEEGVTGIRLSHSTIELLNTCERKFALEKVLDSGLEKLDTADTVFGKAYGVGVQHYFVYQDRELAIYNTWLAYQPHLESEKKTLVKCLNAVEMSFNSIDNLLEEYEVVYFDGKPAEELGFCLLTDTEYYFVGYLDLVLKNRWTGKYIALDIKTTGLELEDLSPLYKNSSQLVGYSIVVDAIAGEDQAEYDVMYFVCKVGRGFTPTTVVLKYGKTLADRLNWFVTLQIDIERLQRMHELATYPMRGGNCLTYNRPCKFFNVCQHLAATAPAKVLTVDKEPYQFTYDINELIVNHINRLDTLIEELP